MFALRTASFQREVFDAGSVTLTFDSNSYVEAMELWRYFCQFFGQTFDPYSMHRQQANQPPQLGQQAAIGHTPQLTDERGQV